MLEKEEGGSVKLSEHDVMHSAALMEAQVATRWQQCISISNTHMYSVYIYIYVSLICLGLQKLHCASDRSPCDVYVFFHY